MRSKAYCAYLSLRGLRRWGAGADASVKCAFAAWGYSKYSLSLKSSREVGGRPPDHPWGVLPRSCGGTKTKCNLNSMMLKAVANGRRNIPPCPDQFRGYRSYTVDRVALEIAMYCY
ncbi:hypothetical protein TNCV_2325041 [Trichonephila clavipes]|nr:hypothetical protein TNCV_2325041 [Trichonephila clavipes]